MLPVLSGLSKAAVGIFYRFQVVGPEPPSDGPLVVFANHPNSLLDPALVAAAAGRPVRFLAKSLLFSDPRVGWLVRAAGAIPVYRRQDDPRAADRNVEMFAAVFRELGRGAAVGIFPEGISHSEPSLSELKTGTARIALGTYVGCGIAFPLVPMGLILRDKAVFRSQALVIRGQPVVWEDLAGRGAEDEEAVRALTRRLDLGLREVTLNLERWQDRPLIECAQAVWAVELGGSEEAAERLRRAQVGASVLADFRRRGDREGLMLARRLEAHRRRLRLFGLEPGDLRADVGLPTSVAWAARRLYLLGPPALLLALGGAALFWLPYHLTDLIVAAARPQRDQLSTFKLLTGAGIYLLWIVLLVALAWWLWGGWVAAALLPALPAIGLTGQWIRERWRGAVSDIRRFALWRSSRQRMLQELQVEQGRLAQRLAVVVDERRQP